MARTAKKAAFVRKHSDKSPAEVIAAGAERGISLSRSYIGKVRAQQPQRTLIVRTVRRAAQPSQAEHPARAEFSQLVWRLGTVRVREWLAALDRETSRDDERV
jgi:hypothetical protein